MEQDKTYDIEGRAFVHGRNRIFYHWSDALDGWFILWLERDPETSSRKGYALWKDFLKRNPEELYFRTDDFGYVKNHMVFHGYYGKQKVYRYVR
jgi:hypothetical protein